MEMDMDFFTQRIQCSRSDKQDSLYIVRRLMELAATAQDFGLLALDTMMRKDPGKYSHPFLKKAISLIVDVSDTQLIKNVLYNYIITGNYSGQNFLESMVITETVLAIQKKEDIDYIFSFLVPSLFGMDFDPYIMQLYMDFKQTRGRK